MIIKNFNDFINEARKIDLEDWMPMYHASNKNYKQGDIVNAKIFHKDIPNWYETKPFEVLMEYFRKTNYPKVISRMEAVYCTEDINNKWQDEFKLKYLWQCSLRNANLKSALVTDSSIITDLTDFFEQDLFLIKKDFKDENEILQEFKKNPKKYLHLINENLANKYWSGDISKSKQEDVEILVDELVVEWEM